MKGSCHHFYLDNLFEMSLFFTTIHIRVVEDMMHKDIALFQKIWEQTNEEQGEVSLLDIRRYFQHHEDIDMGWINMQWGVPQILDASINFPHETMFTLNKVVEQRRASLFPTRLTIEGAPTMLSLETLFDFAAISWDIQVCKKNEAESSNKK
jgi:hypothetical protein